MSLLHGIQAHGAHPVDLPGAVPQGPKPPRYLLSTMFDNAHRGAAGGPSVVSLGLRGGAGAVNSPPFEVSALGRQRSAVMMLEGFGSFPISGGGDSGVTPASPPAPRQLPAAGLRPGVSSTGGSSWIPWLESSARRVGLPGGRVTNDGDAPAQAITSRAPSMGEAPSGAAHWAAAASPKGGKPGGPADHARPSAARAVSFKPPRPTSDKDPETDTTRTTAEDAPAKASNHLFRRVRSSRRDSAGERGPHGQKTLRGVTRQLSRYISRKIRIAPEEEQPQETRGQQLWGIVRAVRRRKQPAPQFSVPSPPTARCISKHDHNAIYIFAGGDGGPEPPGRFHRVPAHPLHLRRQGEGQEGHGRRKVSAAPQPLSGRSQHIHFSFSIS